MEADFLLCIGAFNNKVFDPTKATKVTHSEQACMSDHSSWFSFANQIKNKIHWQKLSFFPKNLKKHWK